MTINVALVTSDALILGCDSVASSTKFLLDPFVNEFAKDSDGEPLLDGNGDFLVPFRGGAHYVVDTFQGVAKQFRIYDRDNCVAAAVTSGLGTINGRTIKNLADEYFEAKRSVVEPIRTIEGVAKSFLEFIREKYIEDQQATTVPEEYWPDLEFLLGGFDAEEQTPTLYRIGVRPNECALIYAPHKKEKSGLAWGGQSESVERLLNGFDSHLPRVAYQAVNDAFDQYRDDLQNTLIEFVSTIAQRHGIDLESEMDVELPQPPGVNIPWDIAANSIGFANIPIQDSVNFVAFLVNAQSAIQRFSEGIATVGGRTHIALLRRGTENHVEMLNEPEILHQFTGFDNV